MADGKTENPGRPTLEFPLAVTPAEEDFKLPYFNDSRFQQIYRDWVERGELLDGLSGVFRNLEYRIPDHRTHQLVLEDAFFLYNVAAGKKLASELLRCIERAAPVEVFSSVVIDLSQYLAPRLERLLSADSADRLDEEQKSRVLDLLMRLRELNRPDDSNSQRRARQGF
jgi:hypothetical protein